jgi:hypothetical protein
MEEVSWSPFSPLTDYTWDTNKFVQIMCNHHNDMFALDISGNVWLYDVGDRVWRLFDMQKEYYSVEDENGGS